MSLPPRSHPRWILACLALLLVLSFGLRLWSATVHLDASASFDERFSLRNVAGILQKGELRPSHALYLGLSYYPQTAVLAASQGAYRLTGWQPLQVLQADGKGFTPSAYFLCRLVNVLYGVLSLFVVFLIGRRLHSPELGLLAATLLAAFLRHIRSSSHFKPDILVVLLAALVLFWSLQAIARPALRRFLKVGLGIGLATATKYTGVASALPITAGVLLFGRRDRRQWGWLVLAGLTSIATFVALNPYLAVVFRYIPKLVGGYAEHGAADKSNHGVVLWRQLAFLTEQPAWWVAPFLFLGTAWLVVRSFRPPPEQPDEVRTGWALVLALFLGHTALHAGGMTLFRAQNYMPVAPAAALITAWGLIESWRWLARRLPGLARPVPAAVFWGGIAIALLARQFLQVYEAAVPTTWQVVQRTELATSKPSDNPQVIFEKALGNFQGGGGPGRYVANRVEKLSQVRPHALDLADVEAFPAERLEGPEAAFYRGRAARGGAAQPELFQPRFFRSRGQAVAVLRHPWRLEGEPLEMTAEAQGETARYRLDPAVLGPRATVSLMVVAPREGARRRWLVRFQPTGARVRLTPFRVTRHRQFLGSTRFTLAGDETYLEILGPGRKGVAGSEVRVVLRRWVPAG